MFQSREQLIEEAWLRYDSNKSVGEKQLSRTDLEACIEAACERVAVAVANQPNYHILQRRVIATIARASRPLHFTEVWHSSQGIGLGLLQLEGDVQATAANLRALSSESLSASHDSLCVVDACVEWTLKALDAHVVAFRPVGAAALGFSAGSALNEIAIEILVSGQVNVWQRGSVIVSNAATVLAGQTVRVLMDGAGAVSLQIMTAAGVEAALVDLATVEAVAVDCQVALLLNATNTILTGLSIAQGRASIAELPRDHRLLKETVQTRGTVSFALPWELDADPYVAPLTHAQSASYRAFPRLGCLWYWAWETAQVLAAVDAGIRVWAGDIESETPLPSKRLEVVGNVIPTWQDIPAQLHEVLVLELISVARERVMTKQKANE